MVGSFGGVLPVKRLFEFIIEESGDILSGRIGEGIQDAALINHLIEKRVRIQVKSTTLRSGTPRYVLMKYTMVGAEE